jgi:lipopolysaccharide export system protein LptC
MNRWFDRGAALLAIGLLATLGIVTFYLAEIARREPPKLAKAAPTEPDYFLTGFSILKLDQSGQPVLRLTAKRLTHYPDRDTSEFDQPKAITLRTDRPPVLMSADKGVGKESGVAGADQLVLTGNASIERSAGAGRPKMTLETQSLTINVELETANGSEPVKITHGETVTLAVGFEYDHQKQLMSLSNNVKSTWPPK